MSAVRRALIVGSGLAGAAVTLALRALGSEVDHVEVRPEGPDLGTGLLLTGNAMVALDALGVGARVRAAGRHVKEVRFTDCEHRELFRLDVEQPRWGDFVSIHRAALQRVLLEAARPPRWGVTVDALELRESSVSAQFSNGSSGEYDLLVGADGVHSRVRQLVFGTAPPLPIEGFSGWRFLARCPPSLANPLYMLGNGCTLLLHPLAGGEVFCGAGPVEDDSLPAGADERERLRATFAAFHEPARTVLERVEERTSVIPTRYWHVPHEPWHQGRCVLVGDAAHACAPTLAQGGAMAFEDAVALRELLAQGREVAPTLSAFEARRRDRVRTVQRESLARMGANRRVAPERLKLRNEVIRRLGGRQLAAVWGPLMEQRP